VTEREEFEAWAKKTLGFWIDDEDIRVLNYVSGGCVPANSTEIAMWDALQAARRTTPDREAIIDSILAKLDPMIRIGVLDEPYHSERNGLIMAWNVVASFKTAPNEEKGDS